MKKPQGKHSLVGSNCQGILDMGSSRIQLLVYNPLAWRGPLLGNVWITPVLLQRVMAYDVDCLLLLCFEKEVHRNFPKKQFPLAVGRIGSIQK